MRRFAVSTLGALAAVVAFEDAVTAEVERLRYDHVHKELVDRAPDVR